jgi:hypothetical protein
MHPVWDRAFEPPAISGGESQTILRALLLLYRKTGQERYLAPIPRAVAYLRRSQLEPGRLARFYELKTNRPIYFTRDEDGRHALTYKRENLVTHYAFVVNSSLDSIEAEYHRLSSTAWSPKLSRRDDTPKASPRLAARARAVIDAMDRRGAWVERTTLRYHKVEPDSGVIDCATFARNVRILCRYLIAAGKKPG